MTRLLATLAFALFILPPLGQCEIAVKGQGFILIKVLPDYPYAARGQHLEGTGFYRLNIKPDGAVSSVTVLKSTGHMLLDQAAIHALRQWRFKPGALHFLKVPLNFTMKGVTY
jgi:TonB family protein